jgi:outer membrane lipoprotein carrier protein
MRLFFTVLLCAASLFALGETTDTMQADFVQTITDDKNSTITYRGEMLAKRPDMSMWHYREPFEKTVYIASKSVTIVEPELEQAIIRKLDGTIDILGILASARKVSKENYAAYYNTKEYDITVQGDKIKSIRYTDAFDNRVSIVFDKQLINRPIDDGRFKAVIPDGFDVISE